MVIELIVSSDVYVPKSCKSRIRPLYLGQKGSKRPSFVPPSAPYWPTLECSPSLHPKAHDLLSKIMNRQDGSLPRFNEVFAVHFRDRAYTQYEIQKEILAHLSRSYQSTAIDQRPRSKTQRDLRFTRTSLSRWLMGGGEFDYLPSTVDFVFNSFGTDIAQFEKMCQLHFNEGYSSHLPKNSTRYADQKYVELGKLLRKKKNEF